MLNKISMLVGTAGLAMILVFGRDVASYLTTSADHVSDSVRSHIPVEFEIERARKMIGDLTPEIRDNMVAIAREEIETERLSEQIAEARKQQSKAKQSLSYLQQELESGRDELAIGATLYTSTEAANLAESSFKRYRTQATTLKNLERTLESRHQGLNAARMKLDEMVAAKEQLAAEVASLEARRKMNNVARTANELSFDDSQLARTRELIRKIETKVRVEERLIATELHFMEEVVPVQLTESSDIATKIANYFAADDVPNGTNELLVEADSAETTEIVDTSAF